MKVRKATEEEIKERLKYKEEQHSTISYWKHHKDGTREWVSEQFESEGTKVAKEEPSVPTILKQQ